MTFQKIFIDAPSAFASQTRKPMQGLAALVGERHAFRNPDSRIGGYKNAHEKKWKPADKPDSVTTLACD